MARHGAWQLQKLSVNYCKFSGSSEGARDFVKSLLPIFKDANPQLAVEDSEWPGRHPYMKAEYLNGVSRTVDLKNASREEILRQAVYLRSSAGRKTTKPIKFRQTHAQLIPARKGKPAHLEILGHSPSIQGAWKPNLRATEQ